MFVSKIQFKIENIIVENVLDGALGLAHNKAQQVFGSTPQTPAMPQPKRSNPAAPSPPHAGIADMLDMAEQAEICDIHDPQSLVQFYFETDRHKIKNDSFVYHDHTFVNDSFSCRTSKNVEISIN